MLRICLLDEIKARHPHGVVDLPGGALVYEVGPRNRDSEVLALMEDTLEGSSVRTGIIIDLAGIAVLTPSAATALAAATARLIGTYHVPTVLTNAAPEVLRGIADSRHVREHPIPPIVLIDPHGRASFAGTLPDRWRNLLAVMPAGGVSASELAGKSSASKKDINKFSVYLQELYNNGLAHREKVSGSDRSEVERGWTYVYSPARPLRGATPLQPAWDLPDTPAHLGDK